MQVEGGADRARFDISLEFIDGAGGSWEIDIESRIDEWPRIEEQLWQVVEALLAVSDPSAALRAHAPCSWGRYW